MTNTDGRPSSQVNNSFNTYKQPINNILTHILSPLSLAIVSGAQEREELLDVMRHHFPFIMRIFKDYMSLGSGNIHAMQRGAFMTFVKQ